MREQMTGCKGQMIEDRDQMPGKAAPSCTVRLRSERGVVLVVVIILSAVSLLIMTALIYMITTGTQISGLQKRYKTALEAGVGGGDVLFQFIGLRAEHATTELFRANLNAPPFNLNTTLTTAATCIGLSSGATYTGFAAKLMTPRTSWVGCDDSLTINPADPTTYDVSMELGTTAKKYNVYAKIVATTDGNSGGDENLVGTGVVSANTGEIAVMSIPFLYAIEVVAEDSARSDERAKLSVLYQY